MTGVQTCALPICGIKDDSWVHLQSRVGETVLRAKISDRVPAGVVYTTFHYPVSGANVITTEFSDWATNCPEYKVTAVECRPSMRGPESLLVNSDAMVSK